MIECKTHGEVPPIVKEKGPHLGLYCPECGKWIKWAKKGEYEVQKRGAYGAYDNETFEAMVVDCAGETEEPPDEECPF
jgi:uncharacterized Zn finger protein